MKRKMIALMMASLVAMQLTACGSAQTAPAAEPAQAVETPAQAVEEVTEAVAEPAEETVGLANPWRDCTEEEANAACARLFKAPEDAVVNGWRMMDAQNGESPLVEMDFRLNGVDFTARAQQGAAEDADISGMNYEWTVTNDVTFANWGEGNMQGTVSRNIADDWTVDLATWYDVEVGIAYSLSAEAADLEGFDIQAVVEAMYAGAEEEVSELPVEEETADGVLGGYLLASDKDKIGTTDENGLLYTVIYAGAFGDTFMNVSGSMSYKNSPDQDTVSVSDDVLHAFVIDENTQFQMLGGEDGPEEVTLEEFCENFNNCLESGLYFEATVSGGVCTLVTIAS